MRISEVLMPRTVKETGASAAIFVAIGSFFGYMGGTSIDHQVPKRVTVQRPNDALVHIETISGTKYFVTLQCDPEKDAISKIGDIRGQLTFKINHIPHQLPRNASTDITRQVEQELSVLKFCSFGFSYIAEAPNSH